MFPFKALIAFQTTSPAMAAEIDIRQTGGTLIKRYRDVADLKACTRADEIGANGDLEGQDTWLAILKAIDALQDVQSGETKH
jgi:hypothetical protein